MNDGNHDNKVNKLPIHTHERILEKEHLYKGRRASISHPSLPPFLPLPDTYNHVRSTTGFFSASPAAAAASTSFLSLCYLFVQFLLC